MSKIVTFGEILLRLSPPSHLRLTQATSFDLYYGCAEANVAASLAKFGFPVKFITSVPANELGESALSMLRSFGVEPVAKIQGKRLGIYYFEQGASERPGKVVYDREDSSFSMLRKGMIDWEKAFEGADWFHWSGITPSLSLELAELCEEALEIASKMGLTISADLNYRPTLWNYGKKANEIMPNLIKYCDLLLGGINESEIVLGISKQENESVESVFSNWMKAFPKLKTIVTTKRLRANASSNGVSAEFYNGKEFLKSKEYNISHIIDRIGAGDAFMAGIIYGLINWPNDHQSALEFAVAATCLKHSISGDINLSTAEEIKALMSGHGGGRVSR
ncbi:2-dehydro-3-deoxygluconokinase [Cloacibacterium rupense]|uniref:2-dehydro-3-deoxygluconokinase n=1 Tax=Cloacibacterium rupense TaxID=517423 RepID=A0ABQ2NFB8_9FLAO|nr:sugar kinase [Cloacibacterium rupense]GGP01932.1 2-dehydro-3-deoxygluconokinase [Cloacibacterium rupense]